MPLPGRATHAEHPAGTSRWPAAAGECVYVIIFFTIVFKTDVVYIEIHFTTFADSDR